MIAIKKLLKIDIFNCFSKQTHLDNLHIQESVSLKAPPRTPSAYVPIENEFRPMVGGQWSKSAVPPQIRQKSCSPQGENESDKSA